LLFTPVPSIANVEYCPAGSVTIALLTALGALAGPIANEAPPKLTVDPNKFAEYALPLRSTPPLEANVVPSATSPIKL
jgi:hypothetical protein